MDEEAATARIARRHAQILGDAPRIEALSIDEYSADLDPLIRQMIAINQSIDAREADLLTDVTEAQAQGQGDMSAVLARLPEIIRAPCRHRSGRGGADRDRFGRSGLERP